MTCERMSDIIDAYLDDELDVVHTNEVEWHLKECPACARQLAGLQSIRTAMRDHAPRYHAPADLKLPFSRPRINPWKTAALALAACLALVITAGALTLTHGSAAQPALADTLLNNHLRSLQLASADRMVDVQSTDRHTVKPWFAGKLPYAPLVRDLTDARFTLLGGRLDVIDKNPIATLLYQRDKHIISLSQWPTPAPDAAPATLPANAGFHQLHWTSNHMQFQAVSDIEPEELQKLAAAFQAAPEKMP